MIVLNSKSLLMNISKIEELLKKVEKVQEDKVQEDKKLDEKIS